MAVEASVPKKKENSFLIVHGCFVPFFRIETEIKGRRRKEKREEDINVDFTDGN